VSSRIYDIAVIGGGINGCGVARDAAGRGLSVLLAEMEGLASATSSASTKLIHGGLRYLEHYEFRLVREALSEREVLWRASPHITRPLRFVLPHQPHLRPAWMIRIGLFLYDHLGGRKLLAPSTGIDLRRNPAGVPLKPEFTKGFEYSDCQTDDARLTILTARDAANHGAEVLVDTALADARRENGLWRIMLEGPDGRREIAARALVNAAGPWVGEVAARSHGAGRARRSVRLVKGSHIVVRKLYDHGKAYIFQNPDGRIVFAIPWEGDFTLIGTTDVEMTAEGPHHVCASPEEVDYLCSAISAYLARPVTPADVVWSFAGIRALYDSGETSASAVTRDYVLDLQTAGEAGVPLLNIYGGKLTTYRELAEEVMEKLAPFFPGMGAPWTRQASLPGGDFPLDGLPTLVDDLRRRYPWLETGQAERLCHAYGTRAVEVPGDAKGPEDMGRAFGGGLTEREAEFLKRTEWARNADDILWRHGKFGLRMDEAQRRAFAEWSDG